MADFAAALARAKAVSGKSATGRVDATAAMFN